MASTINDRKPGRVALTTDEDWRPDWRVQLIPGYKAQRVAEPVPPALIPQMPVIIAALTAVGVDVVGLDDYEAEDIIASLLPKVEKRYGIPGTAYSDFAILRGDPSDGLPGVAGVGPKKAADLVKKYKSVQGML